MTILVYDSACIPQRKDQKKETVLILLLVFRGQISLQLCYQTPCSIFFMLAFWGESRVRDSKCQEKNDLQMKDPENTLCSLYSQSGLTIQRPFIRRHSERQRTNSSPNQMLHYLTLLTYHITQAESDSANTSAWKDSTQKQSIRLISNGLNFLKY